jgi:peptidoglycan/LPS O-acetylase OafA/YrhL
MNYSTSLPDPIQKKSKPNLNYRPDIDGLRAIAVLSVVVFHAFPKWIKGGFIGVDIFFVISGFLISSIIFTNLQQNKFSFKEFYIHRTKRIFPALITILISSYIFGWFVLFPDEFQQLGKHIAASAGFIQNIILWKEAGYFDVDSELKPLMHLWSLGVEEQFYLIYPLLIYIIWRLRINILATIIILLLLSFGLNVIDIEKNSVRTFFMLPTRFWELLMGSLLAYICLFNQEWTKNFLFRWLPISMKQDKILNNALSIIGLLLILASAFSFNKNLIFPGTWALIPVMGAFLIILAGKNTWINQKILSNRVMVFIGLISYPLYLWHWALLSFAKIIESEQPSIEIQIIAVILSFIFAWLTYIFIEKPIRFGRKPVLKAILLSMILGVVGYIGYYTFLQNGLVYRESIKEYAHMFKVIDKKGSNEDLTLPPTTAIIGDSHASHLIALKEVAKRTNETVEFHSLGACPMLLNISSYNKYGKEDCGDAVNKTYAAIENSNSINTVVISLRGHIYTSEHKTTFKNKKRRNHTVVLNTNPELTDSVEIFKIGIRDTLDFLTKNGKKVVFVLNAPDLDFKPQQCINRPLRISKLKSPCAISRLKFEEASQEYRDIVKSVLIDFPKVRLFDASEGLCDEQWCWAEKDGKILYNDTNHFSEKGSLFIAERLWPVIKSMQK